VYILKAEKPKLSQPLELNPAQLAAVTHGEGPLLVVAGAGTGKTRVITERIRYLLETHPHLSGENILAVTFTTKAAIEMKQRVVRALGERGRSLQISTFHAFCLALLEAHEGEQAVIEDIDYWILLRKNLSLLGLDYYKKLSEPGKFLSDFMDFFSRCQDELVTPEDYAAYATARRARFDAEKMLLDPSTRREGEQEVRRIEEEARVYAAAERLLGAKRARTFGGLLMRAVNLLETNEAVRHHWQQKLRYLLVDEFQDTNIAQIELLSLLAGERKNIVAVGDDDQAIYRFRGASFASFKKFDEKFPGHRTINLTVNYRSTARILRAAGQLIRQNGDDRYFLDKPLTPTAALGERVRLAAFGDARAEAEWVAQEIAALHANSAGLPYGGIAVLYRAHRHRDQLVEALLQRRIPFVIKNLSILRNTLVRDLLAYLRVIHAPHDNVSLARVLATPYWGMDPSHLAVLAERASKSRISIYDALAATTRELAFPDAQTRLAEFMEWLRQMREREKWMDAAQFFALLVEKLQLNLLPSDPDSRYVERLGAFFRDWREKSETKKLKELIEYLGYFEEAGEEITLPEEPASLAGEAVQLMTVHGAKGLEFPVVFALRLTQGAFPPWKRKVTIEFPEALMKEALPQGDYQVLEERRLCYVAMTRARLLLTLASVVKKRSRPSVFLEDLLRDPELARRDLAQLAPEVAPAGVETNPGPTPDSPLQPALLRHSPSPYTYSQITRWARARPHSFAAPFARPDKPLQLSASSIETYEQCSLKYKFAYQWKIPTGPHAATTFGNTLHAVIGRYMELRKKRAVAFPELDQILRELWSSAGFSDRYQEEEYRRAGLEQLAAFHAIHERAIPDVVEKQKGFTMKVGGTDVTGYIDQINRLAGRQVEIVDYKTGRPKTRKDADNDCQLSLYALAARQVLRLDPVRLTFYNLATNEPVSTSRDDQDLNKARERVEEVAARIRAGQFEALPGFHCRYCEYRPLCPAHEQLIPLASDPRSEK